MRDVMRQIQAVIFDCDGVLIESETLIGRVVHNYFASHGSPESFDDFIARCVGKQEQATLEETIQKYDLNLPIAHKEEIDRLIMDLLNGEIEPMHGIKSVLANLVLPKAVASNTPAFRLVPFLKAAGLARYFDQHIYSESHVNFPKPKPDLYLYAAEKLDVNPEHCLVFEDSVTGATAGIAAGMNVIGYCGGVLTTSDQCQRLLDLGVQHVIKHWNEFDQLLSQYEIIKMKDSA